MNFSLKKTFIRGITLAMPLVVVAYILKKIIDALKKLIKPLASQLGVEKIFGQITVTVLALLALTVLIFVLGLLMYLPSIARYRNYMQDWLLYFIPSLNHLKLLAEEKLHADSEATNWKPVLVRKDEEYWPAYLIEENEEWVTLALMKIPSTEPLGMLIVPKQAIQYTPITLDQMHHYNRMFGKGYISMISKTSKN